MVLIPFASQPQVNLANDCCMRKWTQVERKIKVKSLWFCESADTTEYMNDPKVELHCVCVCCFIFWKRFHSRMISWGSFSNSFQKKCQSTPHFMLKKANGLAAATRRKRRRRRMLVGLLSYLKMPRNQNESRKVPIILGKSHCAFRLLSFIFFRLEHGFTDWK